MRKKRNESPAIEFANDKQPRYVQELWALREQHGSTLSPSLVLEAARDPDSALHRKFTWDDTAAGEQWRLHQARQLLHVRVRVLINGAKHEMPLCVSVMTHREAGVSSYRFTVDQVRTKRGRKEMLSEAMRELRAIQRRYSMLSELAEVFAAINEAQERMRAA